MISDRVHAWVQQRVRDIPHAGDVEVVVCKPRLVCAEPACPRRTFPRLPTSCAAGTTRLKTADPYELAVHGDLSSLLGWDLRPV
jgi:transposase